MSCCSSRSSLLRTQTQISTRSLMLCWFERVVKLRVCQGFLVSWLKVVLRFIFIHLHAFDLRGPPVEVPALIGLGRVMDGVGKCNLCNGNPPSVILSGWYDPCFTLYRSLFLLSVCQHICCVCSPDKCLENLIILFTVSASTATRKWMREFYLAGIPAEYMTAQHLI